MHREQKPIVCLSYCLLFVLGLLRSQQGCQNTPDKCRPAQQHVTILLRTSLGRRHACNKLGAAEDAGFEGVVYVARAGCPAFLTGDRLQLLRVEQGRHLCQSEVA